MQILVVCSLNSGSIAPFIEEQINSLRGLGIVCSIFTIKGKGVVGYLKNYTKFIAAIRRVKPDVIHAHYGLSGLFANLQRKIPVITTYHGSDINNTKAFIFSKLSLLLSQHNIFVSNKNLVKSGLKNKYSLIPCGVNTELFKPMDKQLARKTLGFQEKGKLVLFASSFYNKVKNYPLAKEAMSILNDNTTKLLELKGYTRTEVALLMNAADVCLMTSFSEGSPQFIKEAMSCNRPIVSTDVGDVKWLFGSIQGCYLTSFEPLDVMEYLIKAFKFSNHKGSTEGRNRIKKLGLSSEDVAEKIKGVYEDIMIKKKSI